MSIRGGNKDFKSLTQWVKFLLYVQIFVTLVSLFSEYFAYQLLLDYQNGVYTSQARAVADAKASDIRQLIIFILFINVYVLTFILLLNWIHQAHYNAMQLGAENKKFTPGWSVAYYFIPVLCFWKPYQAMKELWKASKNPTNFESESTSATLPVWWTIGLIQLFFAGMISNSSQEGYAALIDLSILKQIHRFLCIGLALAFLDIVNNVYKMQAKQLEQQKYNGQ